MIMVLILTCFACLHSGSKNKNKVLAIIMSVHKNFQNFAPLYKPLVDIKTFIFPHSLIFCHFTFTVNLFSFIQPFTNPVSFTE